MGSSWVIWLDPKSSDECLCEKQSRNTWGEGPLKAEAAASPGTPGAREVVGDKEGFPLEPRESRGSAHSLILNVQPPEL